METSNTHDKDIVKVHRADYLLWCATHSNLLGSPLSPLHHLTSRQSSSAMVLQLPPELLLEVFSYLMDSQTTLYSISLVCKSWLACVLPLLYRHPRIMDTYRWATFIVTLTRTKRMLDYGAHVQSVCLFTPKERNKKNAATNQRRAHHQRRVQQSDQQAESRIIGNNVYTAQRRKYTRVIQLTTSSLRQLALSCKNLTQLDLSCTCLIHDNMIAETGEYVSTLQDYAIQRDLTQIPITIESVIELLGNECNHLKDITVQRCEWITAKLIWLMVLHCPNLERLDARKSDKSVDIKKLTLDVLEKPHPMQQHSGGNASTDDIQDVEEPSPPTQEHEWNQQSPRPFEQDLPDSDEEPHSLIGKYCPKEAYQNMTIYTSMLYTTVLELRYIYGLPPRVLRRVGRQQTQHPNTFNNDHERHHFLRHRFQEEHDNIQQQQHDIRTLLPSSSNNEMDQCQSLKGVVYTIIKEAKELGTSDLDWFSP